MSRVFMRQAAVTSGGMPRGHDYVWVTGRVDEFTLQVPLVVGLADGAVLAPVGSAVVDLPPPVRGAWEAYLADCERLAWKTAAWQSFWSGLRGAH